MSKTVHLIEYKQIIDNQTESSHPSTWTSDAVYKKKKNREAFKVVKIP